MRLKAIGKRTSVAEVTAVTRLGVWMLVGDKEYFLPFEEYPWFKDAEVDGVFNVRLSGAGHLHWPALDVDLMVDGLSDPAKYPLVFKSGPA